MDKVKDSDVLRWIVLCIPLWVCLACWYIMPQHRFFTAERLAAEQRNKQDRSPDNQVKKNPSITSETTTCRSGSASDSVSVNDVETCEVSSLNAVSLDAVSLRSSGWKDPAFMLIAVASLVGGWWSFNFYAYTVFPILIVAEGGPSLSTVSFLYSVEGLTYMMFMLLLWSYLNRNYFFLYFGNNLILAILPPLVICFLGHIHWSAYIGGLFMMDVASAVMNAALGVVLLRCVDWNSIPKFYSQVNTVGGFVGALSNLQFALSESIGWEFTVLVGHGIPLAVAGIICLVNWKGLAEVWNKLD